MLPIGHVAYTLGAWELARERFDLEADYRLVALAALLPDLVDKPLSLLIFTEARTSQGLAHTLLLHALILMGTALFWRRGILYALAFNGHLLLDRMWLYPHTLFYPFLGWRFEPWRFMGTPEAMLENYLEIIQYPGIIACEVGGLAVLAWLVFRHRLYRWETLKGFLFFGKVPSAGGEKKFWRRYRARHSRSG